MKLCLQENVFLTNSRSLMPMKYDDFTVYGMNPSNMPVKYQPKHINNNPAKHLNSPFKNGKNRSKSLPCSL